MTNSSPAYRQTRSESRACEQNNWPTSRSTSSPFWWPSESLIALNSSRSMQSTDNGRFSLSARVNSSWRCTNIYLALCRPVIGSVSADSVVTLNNSAFSIALPTWGETAVSKRRSSSEKAPSFVWYRLIVPRTPSVVLIGTTITLQGSTQSLSFARGSRR